MKSVSFLKKVFSIALAASIIVAASLAVISWQGKNNTINIFCYGDSNVYGFDPNTDGDPYPEEVIWTSILQKELGEEYNVIPEGKKGRTTIYDRPDHINKNGLGHLGPLLALHTPVDFIILMLGTNDCASDINLSVEEIAAGMDVIVDTAKRASFKMQGYEPKIILIVPPAILPELEGTPFDHRIDHTSVEKSLALAPLYEQIAEKYGCLFLDLTHGMDISPVDCVHLTEEGHKQLADLILPMIKENT